MEIDRQTWCRRVGHLQISCVYSPARERGGIEGTTSKSSLCSHIMSGRALNHTWPRVRPVHPEGRFSPV